MTKERTEFLRAFMEVLDKHDVRRLEADGRGIVFIFRNVKLRYLEIEIASLNLAINDR